MNYTKITYIYGLYEVGEDNIRYIGKSDNPIKRLRDHRNDKSNTHKTSWIKSVLKNGGQIGIKIIETVNHENWKEREIYHISEYRKKHRLVNLTDGGDGLRTNIYNKTYQECKKWISLNKPGWVNSIDSYKKWAYMKNFPIFLPKAPDRVFNDWINWGDYLSTGYIQTHKRSEYYLSYEEAKKYIRDNFNFKNSVEFRKGKIPTFIPKKPYNIYSEWSGWDNFLGYKYKRRKITQEYLSYADAKKWISENYNYMTANKFRELAKNDLLPINIPKKPERYYKNEFISFRDFFSK